MKNRVATGSYFKAGMYLLENLTTGMYTEPMSIYREYIQNAVDSIDLATSDGRSTLTQVNIALDPLENKITISDNGTGIPAEFAQQILSSIGSSNKTGKGLRGFRGIGRLGGIAFSDKAIFRTKAIGEDIESIQEWDCKKLRNLLSDPKMASNTLKDSFQEITQFSRRNSKRSEDSYFEVTLYGVSSFRNYIMDIEKIRHYISQIAPVPFNPHEFSYGDEIDAYLSTNLSHYGKYNITLNGEPIYKPYRDNVKLTKRGFDYIDGIKFFEIRIKKDTPVAYGWYGVRRDLLGSIIKGDKSSGIRVRVGNILIGDDHLLDGCFRESRFNSYMIGEIHVDSPDLIPNSRRDDFVDNQIKTLFYNAIEREIGLPISKEIRLRSRIRANEKSQKIAASNGKTDSCHQTNNQCINSLQTIKISQINQNLSKNMINYSLEYLHNICGSCPKLMKILPLIEKA